MSQRVLFWGVLIVVAFVAYHWWQGRSASTAAARTGKAAAGRL